MVYLPRLLQQRTNQAPFLSGMRQRKTLDKSRNQESYCTDNSRKQEYINDLNRYELLVIDDLAIERDTEYTAEIVQNVVDSRYRAGLPLIVTTNLKISELMQPHDIRKKRLYSRLKEMCLMIEVSGEDRREKQFYENYAEYKNLLGL